MNIDYTRLPTHMQDSTRLYIEQGQPPGPFLSAVLCNNLVYAFTNADGINTANMKSWATFLYINAPRGCWGSRAIVDAWSNHDGLNGLTESENSNDQT